MSHILSLIRLSLLVWNILLEEFCIKPRARQDSIFSRLEFSSLSEIEIDFDIKLLAQVVKRFM